MVIKEIKIDLTGVRGEESRNKVKSLLEEKGIAFNEINSFWSSFERDDNSISDNAIVFSDLRSLVDHLKADYNSWAFKVNKMNPYFISFISNKRDEKLAHLIDELLKHSYNRLAILNSTEHLHELSQRENFINEVNNIISRYYNTDSVRNIGINKTTQSFMIEFNDGEHGEVTFQDLQLEDVVDQLLLDSMRISDRGDSVEIFTKDGKIFDIDSVVLKSLISSDTKDEIRSQTQSTTDAVGKRLRQARKKRDMTQKELSELIGIDQAVISKIETGKHLPRFDTLETIAKGLGFSLSELLNMD